MTAEPHFLPSGRLANAEGLHVAENPRNITLIATLAFAVPLRVWELRDVSDQARAARARRCAQIVAEHGDILMFGSKSRGKAAEVFNALAEGVACAAYQPGGITFAGRHWCTDHAACVSAEASADEAMSAPSDCEPAMPPRTLPFAFEVDVHTATLDGRFIANVPTGELL